MIISVQKQDFDIAKVSQQLCDGRKDIGAIATFTGLVRDLSQNRDLVALELEHYPGMTEKSLKSIAQDAMQRWDIEDAAIIHRVGKLKPSENIVLVVVISAHRKAAFEACEFLMDYLKTRAPLWKKEITRHGEHWVEAKLFDQQAAEDWK